MNPPELGVGIIYWSGLEPLVQARPDLIDVLEVEPQGYWFETRGVEVRATALIDRIIGFGRPLLLHGVGMPIGGSVHPSPAAVAAFRGAVDLLQPDWVSEHLSFDRVANSDGAFHTGFLLPPRQDDAGVRIAAQGIIRLQEAIGRPVAFETGVSYLRPRDDEMPDGEFFAAVAEAANCGILLDLHNVWCNERNGRQTVAEVLEALPRERVWEMHLAGGYEEGGYWLDAHSGLVPDAVMQLAREVVVDLPRLGAVIFEIMTPYVQAYEITTSQLADQLEAIHDVWSRRRRRVDTPVTKPGGAIALQSPAPSVAAWEEELGTLVARPAVAAAGAYGLVSDPGVTVLRKLVETIRAGHLVTLLPLTYRLLRTTLPASGVDALIAEFYDAAPPEPFAVDAARNLASFLDGRELGNPYIAEVLAFEIGLREQALDREPREFRFTTEPMALLSALGAAQPPPAPQPGDYVLVVEP